jgi:O-antigen ligase
MNMLQPAATAQEAQTRTLLTAWSLLIIGSLLTGLAGNWWFLAGIPALALLGYVALVDFRKLLYLLFFFIPLTVEVWLPNGIVTDMPTEQISVVLTGLYLLYLLRNWRTTPPDFVRHPISLLLLLHLGWFFFTAITSDNFIISIKFAIAKIWYVVPFFYLAGIILKEEKDLRKLTWVFLFPLCFTIVVVLARHAAIGFSFAEVNTVMAPFYRNKVAYACTLAVSLPFVWYARKHYARYSLPWWVLGAAAALLLIGIQFSYTRAVYGMIVLGIAAIYLVKWRMMKIALSLAAVLAFLYVGLLVYHNNYLDYKPDYNKAITHDKFDDLLSATTRGQDVSTMERVYRWVAGGQMVGEKPWLGFGPGTFTFFYKSYTLFGFRTYVSDNEEGSGIHCYYLMTLVEQGFIGAFLFLALVFYVLLKAEQIYHQTTDPARRRMVLTALLTTVIIDGLLVVNDLVETDKIGSFFFLCMAILVNVDLQNNKTAGEKVS